MCTRDIAELGLELGWGSDPSLGLGAVVTHHIARNKIYIYDRTCKTFLASAALGCGFCSFLANIFQQLCVSMESFTISFYLNRTLQRKMNDTNDHVLIELFTVEGR
jgi:hypothetical protein